GSQYFLTLTDQPHLDGHYTLFAFVTRGLATMDELVEGDSINAIHIQQ
ncbi:MAG: peptidylprolyl isomerase, partial [Gemmatimonadaceae bacterium]